MDELDLRIRNHVYSSFVRDGGPPTVSGTAGELGLTDDAVEAALRRLHGAHALVLHAGRTEIRMLNPFSVAETRRRARAYRRVLAIGVKAFLGHLCKLCGICSNRRVMQHFDMRLSELKKYGKQLLPALPSAIASSGAVDDDRTRVCTSFSF